MSYPKTISIYNKDTGIVVQTLYVLKESDIILSNDFDFIEGSYKPNKFKVVDGVVETYKSTYITGVNEYLVRKQRNLLLVNSDWTQLPDSPLSQTKKNAWSKYRQELRDMMASYTDTEENTLDKVIFPKPPK